MSAKEKQVVEIQEKLDDITECPICTETYKEPKILPCIHTFCMLCLQETGLKTNKGPGYKMPCPVCRTEFTVPEKGFVGLQRNFFMERLIEMKDILNPSSEGVLCDACQEDNDLGSEAEISSAEMYCADCNQRLCGECCKIHRKNKASKNHRMLQLDGGQINIPSIVKPYVCDKHENKLLEIYCSSCQETVCALCLYKSHKTHDTSPVIEVITDFRRIIQENADAMMTFSRNLKEKATRKNSDKEMFVIKVAAVESEIKRVRQDLRRCTEKNCDSLLQQLKLIKQEKIKENESQLCDIETVLASMVSYQAYCTKMTTIGSDVDICGAVHNLKTRASELKQLYESVSLETFPNIWLKKTEFHNSFFKTGNNIIGKLQAVNGDIKASEVEDFTDKISCDKLVKLNKELSLQQERISRQEEVIFLKNREAHTMQLTAMQSDVEIADLKKQVALLSSIAYNGDKTKELKKTSNLSKGLTFLQTISTVDVPSEKGFRVTGLAILDNELFFTSASNVVEVNDLRTLKFKRRWRAEEMQIVVDMKDSVHNKCIYLLCGCNKKQDGFTFVYEARFLRCNIKGIVVRQWKPDVGAVTLGSAQMSVTDKSNVLVTNGSVSKFTEYSPDGDVIRVISLKWESCIEHLMHAIKLTSDHFLICHGKDKDSLHRVCIIDIDGNVLKYYGDIRQTVKLNSPIYLEMAADGNILVADHLNKRLLLFNSSLEAINQLKLPSPGISYDGIDKRPRKMLLDEANCRLFVVENIWKPSANRDTKTQYNDRLSVFSFPVQ